VEENEYKGNEKVLFKTTGKLSIPHKKPEEVDCFVTEGHVVIEAEEPIKISVSSINDFTTSFLAPDLAYSLGARQPLYGTASLTFIDNFNKKQKLSLDMAAGDLGFFEQAIKLTKEYPGEIPALTDIEKHKTDIEGANKAIKYAWIAATISAGLTLIFAVTGLFGLDLWALWIVIVMLGLAFGIYKKNRACAVILFVFWVFDIILGFWDSVAQGQGAPPIGQGIVWTVFAICFFWGIRGTFAYHRIVKAERISKANSEIDTGSTGTAK